MGTRYRRSTWWNVDYDDVRCKGLYVPFFIGIRDHLIVNLLKPFPLPHSLY